jgi:membrane protein involved in colicin uptake
LEAEENTRLEAKREEREAAEEAGMTLTKYRRSQRNKAKAEDRKKAKKAKAEDRKKAKKAKGKILEEKSADEISSIVISSFEEILGDDFNGDLSVSLDIEEHEINCELPSRYRKKRKQILIGKGGSTIKQVAKQISEKLDLDWIRVNIV